MTAAYYDRDNVFMLVEVDGDSLFFEAVARNGMTVDSGVIHRRAGDVGGTR
jgi:hypothetical protein